MRGVYAMIKGKVEVDRALNALRLLDKKGAASAVSKSLNGAAEAVEKQAQKNAKARIKVRKKRSISGIKQDRHAKGNDIGRMYARTVIQPSWMEAQEFGGANKPAPGFDKVAVPSKFSRGGNELKQVKKPYWIDAMKLIVAQAGYDGKGFSRFFLGEPKGGNRTFGIWLRHNNNKKLTQVRSMTKDKTVDKPKRFFRDAVKKFGTYEFVVSQLSKNCQAVIKKIGLDMK